MFPGTPIVFCGIDRREIEHRALPGYVTGVLLKREFSPTLQVALRLHPDTTRVVFVGGTSEFDARLVEQARGEFRSYEDRLSFTYLTMRSLRELLAELANLPPHTIVLYSTLFRDGADKSTIMVVVGIVVLQSVLIVALLFERRVRRRAQKKLRDNEAALRSGNERIRDLAGQTKVSVRLDVKQSQPQVGV